MVDEKEVIDLFRRQSEDCLPYRTYLGLIGCTPGEVRMMSSIPMLPIRFFRTHRITSTSSMHEHVFYSSGTTGDQRSAHYITSIRDYQRTSLALFEREVFPVIDVTVMALLPGYAPSSSLITMIDALIDRSSDERSGFYGERDRWPLLIDRIEACKQEGRRVLLFGVTHGLLDFARSGPFDWGHVYMMETGGMKGRGRELIRSDLHDLLSEAYHPRAILSEYGMTELLSQAYAADGMRYAMHDRLLALPGDLRDPFGRVGFGELSRIDLIDLANQDSCAFIATEDLGRIYEDGTFEVLGRIDHSVVRGCSLMMA